MAVVTEEVDVRDVAAVPAVHVAGSLGRRHGGRELNAEGIGAGKCWDSASVPHSSILPCSLLPFMQRSVHDTGGPDTATGARTSRSGLVRGWEAGLGKRLPG